MIYFKFWDQIPEAKFFKFVKHFARNFKIFKDFMRLQGVCMC